jgi:hypothetical protein
MIVGGSDLIFFAPADVPVVGIILRRVRQLWPLAWFQDPDEDKAHRIDDPRVISHGGESREFLIYRDQAAVSAWDRDGATPENLDSMLYFLIGEASEVEPGRRELTLVCGERTQAIEQLVRDLESDFDAAHSERLDRPRAV